jgi:hypothetical protein
MKQTVKEIAVIGFIGVSLFVYAIVAITHFVPQASAATERGTWVTVFGGVARTTTATSDVQLVEKRNWKGILFTLNITASSGTPTLDCKVQIRDPITPATFIDITGAAFAQKTGTGTDYLLLYPGTVETANKRVSFVAPGEYRVVCTMAGGTPNMTYTMAASYHK